MLVFSSTSINCRLSIFDWSKIVLWLTTMSAFRIVSVWVMFIDSLMGISNAYAVGNRTSPLPFLESAHSCESLSPKNSSTSNLQPKNIQHSKFNIQHSTSSPKSTTTPIVQFEKPEKLLTHFRLSCPSLHFFGNFLNSLHPVRAIAWPSTAATMQPLTNNGICYIH